VVALAVANGVGPSRRRQAQRVLDGVHVVRSREAIDWSRGHAANRTKAEWTDGDLSRSERERSVR
jgi:hypothetical protein